LVARAYNCLAVRACPFFSSSSACPVSWSVSAVQAARKSVVPASSPRVAASRIGRHARSTSSISPPLLRVATTPRFQT
jgi:hypothetical protein